MKIRLFLLAGSVATLAALSGCNPAASNASLTGNWAGSTTTTLSAVVNQPTTTTASLIQNGTVITGSMAVISSEASYTSTVVGSFNGTTLNVELSPLDLSGCSYVANLSYANNVLSGLGTAYNCPVTSTMEIVLRPL